MNQREKILAISTGVVVVLIVGIFGYQRVQSGFATKDKEISSLKTKIRKNDDIIFEGADSDANLRKLLPRSLPSDITRASTEYRNWLTSLGQQLKMDVTIDPKKDKEEKGLFINQSFTLRGKGDLGQLVDLIYLIQEKDFLHRISLISLTPVTNEPYTMNITLQTDAMSLLVADRKQAPPKTLSNRNSKTYDEYANIILGRNLFSPENLAPQLKPKATTKIAKGEVLKYDVGAKDPENTYIDYAIVGDIPRGLKIDQKTGALSWEPKEIGNYEFLILAQDRGIPRKTSEQLLTINVVDPPPKVEAPPEKKFDVATQAVVTAYLAGGKKPEIWINSRVEAKMLYLKIGDDITLGSITGKVIAIGANYAEFETDGKRWTVTDNDKNLAEAFKRMEEPKQPAS